MSKMKYPLWNLWAWEWKIEASLLPPLAAFVFLHFPNSRNSLKMSLLMRKPPNLWSPCCLPEQWEQETCLPLQALMPKQRPLQSSAVKSMAFVGRSQEWRNKRTFTACFGTSVWSSSLASVELSPAYAEMLPETPSSPDEKLSNWFNWVKWAAPVLAFACEPGLCFKPASQGLREWCACWGLSVAKSHLSLSLKQSVVGEGSVTVGNPASSWLELYFIV